jgi:hypothetical protein
VQDLHAGKAGSALALRVLLLTFRQPFICTSTQVKLKEHSDNKRARLEPASLLRSVFTSVLQTRSSRLQSAFRSTRRSERLLVRCLHGSSWAVELRTQWQASFAWLC